MKLVTLAAAAMITLILPLTAESRYFNFIGSSRFEAETSYLQLHNSCGECMTATLLWIKCFGTTSTNFRVNPNSSLPIRMAFAPAPTLSAIQCMSRRLEISNEHPCSSTGAADLGSVRSTPRRTGSARAAASSSDDSDEIG